MKSIKVIKIFNSLTNDPSKIKFYFLFENSYLLISLEIDY